MVTYSRKGTDLSPHPLVAVKTRLDERVGLQLSDREYGVGSLRPRERCKIDLNPEDGTD